MSEQPKPPTEGGSEDAPSRITFDQLLHEVLERHAQRAADAEQQPTPKRRASDRKHKGARVKQRYAQLPDSAGRGVNLHERSMVRRHLRLTAAQWRRVEDFATEFTEGNLSMATRALIEAGLQHYSR